MRLREWLYKNGKYVKDFAQEIGYDRSYISAVMCGKKSPPKRFVFIVKMTTKGKVSEEDWEGIVADPFKKMPIKKKK